MRIGYIQQCHSRKTPNNSQVAIRVDLNRALSDPRENILVQAADILILQVAPSEALAKYVSQVFDIRIIIKMIDCGSAQSTAGV